MKDGSGDGASKGSFSPLRSLVTITVSIFLAEFLVMTLLAFLPPFLEPVEAFFDASLLVILVFPFLYFFLLKPMIVHMKERKMVEENLNYYKNHLEDLVEDRSNKLDQVTKELEDKMLADNRAEAKYYDLYENAPDMFASVDSNSTKIVECNITFANELGYSKDKMIGRKLLEVCHSNSLDVLKNHFDVFQRTGSVSNVECQLKRKDGSRTKVILNALNASQMYPSQIHNKDGKILRVRFTII
jgi:PAS domain S-box-containing protein